jgi:hypothetical protein
MSAEAITAAVAVVGMAALVFLIIRNGGKGG